MNPMRNSEGYFDPTAYHGTAGVIKEETEAEQKNRTIIQTFRRIADLPPCTRFMEKDSAEMTLVGNI